MKSLSAFWRKDLINKLIVLISGGLIVGVLALLIMTLVMPEDKSVWGAVSQYLPAGSPTVDTGAIFTRAAETAQVRMKTLTPPVPTITSRPTQQPTLPVTETPFVAPPSPTLDLSTLMVASATPQPAPTGTTVSVIAGAMGSACIPAKEAQKGVPLEILTGNTARVLIDGLVYTVRYIGIEVPADTNYAEMARLENSKLVFGKEIQLIAGDSDKDDRGRLLRYVKVGETFVNLELIRKGLAVVPSTATEFSCLAAFKAAEQEARAAKSGWWNLPQPTSNP